VHYLKARAASQCPAHHFLFNFWSSANALALKGLVLLAGAIFELTPSLPNANIPEPSRLVPGSDRPYALFGP